MMLCLLAIIRILGRGRHASKTHFYAEPHRQRVGPVGHCGRARTRQAHRPLVPGAAAGRADRAAVGDARGARFAGRQGGRSHAVSAEQPQLSGRADPRPRFAGALAVRRIVPQGDDRCAGQRAVSRPAGRSQLGLRPHRSRVHVPARSAGRVRPGAGRARHPVARGRRADGRDDDCRRGGGAGRSAGSGGRGLHGQARRHAVEDRERGQARVGLARADAGRAVQVERERVRRQQHEPAADRRDPDGAFRRRGGVHPGERGREDDPGAGRRLARLSRPACRGRPDGRWHGWPHGRRADRHGGPGEDPGGTPRRRPVARFARAGRRQGRRRGRVGRRGRQAAQGRAGAHRRTRAHAEGHAARRRTQEPVDGAIAAAGRRIEGQGRRAGDAGARASGEGARTGEGRAAQGDADLAGARAGRAAEGRRAAQGRAAEGRGTREGRAAEGRGPAKVEPPKAADPLRSSRRRPRNRRRSSRRRLHRRRRRRRPRSRSASRASSTISSPTPRRGRSAAARSPCSAASPR